MTGALEQKNKSVRLHAGAKAQRRLVEYFVVVSSIPSNKSNIVVMDDNNSSDGHSNSGSSSSSSSRSSADASSNTIEKIAQRELNFEAVITSRYPTKDHEKNPLLHEGVISFCHPSEEIELKNASIMPKIHYFASTGRKGGQMYGVCLTVYEPFTIQVKDAEGTRDVDVFHPKCICILSAYPYLVAFREYLTQLERLSKSGEMNVPLERYISNFCSEVAAPPPGSFEVQTTISNSVIKLWSPPYNQPIPWISLPFAHLFECLDIEHVITIWHALALERQVLVVSTQKTLLTTACEILISLLFPMRWSHAYIPLLPKFLISILSAPMPYLCGIDKAHLNTALKHLNEECIVVDLDCNHVSFGPNTPPLPPIPKVFAKKLNAKLKENAGMIFREARSLSRQHDFSDRGQHLPPDVKMRADAMWESKLCLYDEAFHLSFTSEQEGKNLLNGNYSSQKYNTSAAPQKFSRIAQSKWDAVQEAFMTVYVGLLSSYRQCLVFPSKDGISSNDSVSSGSYGGAGFRSKEFVKAQRNDRRNFLKELINTQMFDDFITKRLYGSGASDVTFFDLAIDRYLKKDKFAIDRSFHPDMKENDSAMKEDNARPTSAPDKMRQFIERVRADQEEPPPLLCSPSVHRRLKTIVPPEPSNENLPEGGHASYTIAEKDVDSDELSLESKTSKQTTDTELSSPLTSFESPEKQRSDNEIKQHPSVQIKGRKYKYSVFPSKLDESLYGKPRPLPAAVLAEFDRQTENAAQFRKNGKKEFYDPLKSPEETTFTVFFMALTSIIGRELQKLSSNKNSMMERTILSSESSTFGDDDSDSDSHISGAKNLDAMFEKVMSSSSSVTTSASVDESVTQNRFRDNLYSSKLEEAKLAASAQLDLAFEILDIMKERNLSAGTVAYKCLIDACGRCGDTNRATKLLSKMHGDGIVADGVVYSCLVAAFSEESTRRKASGKSDLPEWANGASVCVDWNKVGKPSRRHSHHNENSCNESRGTTLRQSMMNILRKVKSQDFSVTEDPPEEIKSPVSNPWADEPLTPEKFVTDTVYNHIGFGENLLEIVYPDISIDTDNERCPDCNTLLLDDMVVSGWTPGDSQDYTTACPNCGMRFVPKFRVQSTSQSFVGSRGKGTPLICERLSPWVLEKELRTKMGDWDGIDDLLDMSWREKEPKNAILWWNLILAFMRYRIPFTFLLQGNFGKNLIIPMPQDHTACTP